MVALKKKTSITLPVLLCVMLALAALNPPGKAQERPLITSEEVEANLRGIREQLSRFLDFNSTTNPALMINNADWLCNLKMLDFLRDIGKYFSVNDSKRIRKAKAGSGRRVVLY